MIENSRDNVEKMFFLTKTDGVEISSFEEVFNCGNQCLLNPRRPDLEFDRFGRNYTDRLFVELCMTIYILFHDEERRFKSLFCKKVGDQYSVRLKLSDEIFEMELSEMIATLAQRFQTEKVRGDKS